MTTPAESAEERTPAPREESDIEQVPRGPDTPVIDAAKLPKLYPAVKRLLEVPVAVTMTAMMSPLLLGVAVAAYVGHGYPALFLFPRMGKRGKPFSIFKFRTMVTDAKERMRNGASNEELITKLGHVLRNTHLDEIAQIFNVVFGHISFVGPRPMDQDTFDHLHQENEIWTDILETRPGVTCLESIIADLPEHEEKIRKMLNIPPAPAQPPTMSLPRRYPLDRFYIENESLWMDIVIVWYTVKTLAGRAAPHR